MSHVDHRLAVAVVLGVGFGGKMDGKAKQRTRIDFMIFRVAPARTRRLCLVVMNALKRRFFQQDVVNCARGLVGCKLVWANCSGVVVETEAYAEHHDPACHTASRPSARMFIQDHPPGSAYVYFNYGMHWMLNVLTKSPTHGNGLILIRALRPTGGIDEMRIRRAAKLRSEPPSHDRWLCSGPGKLAAALAVTGDDHGRDLCADERFGFLARSSVDADIHATPRIGISKATDFLWRFHLEGDDHVSR